MSHDAEKTSDVIEPRRKAKLEDASDKLTPTMANGNDQKRNGNPSNLDKEEPNAVLTDLVGNSPFAEDAPAMPQVVVDPTKDLWQNIALNTKESNVAQSEVSLIVVGAPGSGKSTVLQRLFASLSGQGNSAGRGSGKVKPTTALDYSFARRTDRHVSQVAHFWELAQGVELSHLFDVVVTPENIHAVVVMIVVDCSDPSTMWETISYWLKRIDRRVMEIFQKMRAKGSTTPDKMMSRVQRAIGMDHPDLRRLRLSGVPTVIVCNKLDIFSGDTSSLKTMVRCMRFISHLYGANLVLTCEAEVTKFRALMHHLLFQAPFDPKHVQFDPERGGVLVTADKDTFTDIGDPMISNMRDFQSTGDGDLDRWKAPFDAAFPPRKIEGRTQNDVFLKKLYDTSEGGFGEPTIDAIRKQKDDDLDQYRKASSKREKNTQDEGTRAKKKLNKDGDSEND